MVLMHLILSRVGISARIKKIDDYNRGSMVNGQIDTII
jgi:hypothetical protein